MGGKKVYMIDGAHRFYRVTCIADIDAILRTMCETPESERGQEWSDEVDILLDGRNLVALEESL
jgi:hypothetical protein